MSANGIKVTDKRIFTEDGELREQYRHLEGDGAESEEATGTSSPGTEPAAPAGPRQSPEPERARDRPSLESMPAPRFLDLVGMIAEPVAVFLGEALPDGQQRENLELARFHIDLLDVLREKTAGNLEEQERAVLEDLVYRLRLQYVKKRS